MKKYFLLAAAAATVLAVSCNKEKNQPKVDPTPGTEIEDNTPQPILFGSNMGVVKAPITKGDGAIDKWDDIGTAKLYVYGVVNTSNNHQAPNYGDLTAEGAIKIKNVAADAPDTGNAGLDYRDPINVYETGTTPFYYDDQKKYDFYGYFVDNAATISETNPEVAASTITLKNIAIDGTQDIMWANTDKVADEGARADRTKYVALNQLYSDVSARRGVKPNLNFQHQLSRFVFNVKAADEIVASGAPTTENGKVTIKNVKLQSKTAAELLIVGTPAENTPRLTFTGDASYLTVPQEAGFTALTTAYQTFGEAMVAPGEVKYNFQISFAQKGSSYTDENPYTRTLEIDFSDNSILHDGSVNSEKAEAGKKYVVNVIIYGLEEIKITVSLVEWEDADILDIDPDEGEDPADRDAAATLAIPAVANIAVGATADIDIAGITAQDSTPTDIIGDDLTDLKNALYFTSSNQSIVRVNPRTGKLTAVAVGTATITATASTAKYLATGTVDVEVIAAPVAQQVTINAVDANIVVGNGSYVDVVATVQEAAYGGTLAYDITGGTGQANASITNNRVTLTGAATVGQTIVVTITAPADNGNNFLETTKDITLTVVKAENTLTVSNNELSYSNAGTAGDTAEFTITNDNGGALSYTYKQGDDDATGLAVENVSGNTYKISITNAVVANTYTVNITSAETETVKAKTVSITLTVTNP